MTTPGPPQGSAPAQGSDSINTSQRNTQAVRYSIEEADLDVAAPLIESLWVRNLQGHDVASARAKLQLGYVNNPAGRGRVMLLEADGAQEAQGTQGLHPRRFHLGAHAMRAVSLADYVVNPEHRSLGPALMLLRRSVHIGNEQFDLIYGFPNIKAAPVFGRAGLTRLGILRRYAKPLASREQLARRMPRWLARCCAPLVDQAWALRDRIRALGTRAPLVCRPAAWNDPAFAGLWARRPAATLLSERTGEMLTWRFGPARVGDWRVCLAMDANGVAQGYVVWRSTGGFAEVGDFFAADPEVTTLPLMLAFARLARRARLESVSLFFFGAAGIAAQLHAAGMVVRPQQMQFFTGAATATAFHSPEVWYLTDFDNDAD